MKIKIKRPIIIIKTVERINLLKSYPWILCWLILGSSFSCSHLKENRPSTTYGQQNTSFNPSLEIEQFQHALNSICLSGEGRGRFFHLDEKYQFSFESLYQPSQKLWTLAISFPLKGEKIFYFPWQEVLMKEQKVLAEVMLSQQEGQLNKSLEMLLFSLAEFFHFHDMINKSDQERNKDHKMNCQVQATAEGNKGVCSWKISSSPSSSLKEKSQLQWVYGKDFLKIFFPYEQGTTVTLLAKDMTLQKWQRINLTLQQMESPQKSNSHAVKMQLDLSFSECITP